MVKAGALPLNAGHQRAEGASKTADVRVSGAAARAGHAFCARCTRLLEQLGNACARCLACLGARSHSSMLESTHMDVSKHVEEKAEEAHTCVP